MSDDKIKSLINIYSKIKTPDEDSIASRKVDIDLIKAIKSLTENREQINKGNISREEKIDLLQKRYTSFKKKNDFKKGGLVKWKTGLKNKSGLEYWDTAIIIDILDTPLYDEEKDSGSPYFKEPLDMVIAFLDSDNDFITLHVDSRRMQPLYNP